ncbi:MAG TPA: EMC3/TMCO1 family protein [Candidatus Nanoarchaeia archaeon]|nr:EMC3/TMCO1 family protein [Candidatus Nanoarchaeia archaeon]
MVFLQSFFDKVFFFHDLVSPFMGVVIISVIMTLLSTLAYKFLTNQSQMKTLKEELKSLQSQMKEHKENRERVMELQKLAMEKNLVYMKHSFRPMLFTFVPLIVIFGWIRETFGAPAGQPSPILIDLPLLPGLTWIWVYIIVSLLASMLIRKLFKIH